METSVLGLHHVTAITGDPQQSIDFYTQVLGLRLVKVTVDVNDPETYHLVFGTETGEPGTLLSFHCWPGAIQGRPGTGQVLSAALSVPPGSMEYWRDRLTSWSVATGGEDERDRFQSLYLRDCDGLLLELVVDDALSDGENAKTVYRKTREEWTNPRGPRSTESSQQRGRSHRANPSRDPSRIGACEVDGFKNRAALRADRRSVPVERAIHGLHGITIAAGSSSDWSRFLTTVLGLDITDEDALSQTYSSPKPTSGSEVIVRAMPYVGRGITTVGYVHHAAFRVPDHDLVKWRSRVARYTDTLAQIEDHVYYRALRLQGPEGVRFELASDGPGITVDEAPPDLGTHLVLPRWLEPHRLDLERRLPPLRLPEVDGRR